jgi:signal transduction histidine kinase
MSITFAAIKSHKGEIRIESDLGKGTTFHVLIPVLDSGEAGSKEQQS